MDRIVIDLMSMIYSDKKTNKVVFVLRTYGFLKLERNIAH